MRAGFLLTVVFGVSSIASATPAPRAPETCDCYALTAWTNDNGLPTGSIVAITQALDRYLWLATTDGLIRFDGYRFTRWGTQGEPALASLFISALLGSPDGSLWVAFNDVSGVTHIQSHDQVRHYGEADGLRSGPVTTLLEDRQGTVWVGGRQGLVTFRSGEWLQVGPKQGLPVAEVSSLYEDGDGGLWVGTSAGVFHSSTGGDRFEVYDMELRLVQNFAQDGAGAMWVTDPRRALRTLVARTWPTFVHGVSRPAGGLRLLSDENGNIWIAALGSGLLRLRVNDSSDGSVVERFNYEHKFAKGASGGVRSLFKDDEGNVWVGMRAGGLLRIARTDFEHQPPLEGMTNDGARAIAASSDGSVWIATGQVVNRFTAHGRESYDIAQTMAMYVGRDSELWVATSQALRRFEDGRFVVWPMKDSSLLSRLSAMTVDTQGNLWLCGGSGLSHWEERVRHPLSDEITRRRPCRAVLSDRQGRLWAGFGDGSVTMLHGHNSRRFSTSTDGVAPGGVVRFHEDSHGDIWVATRGGLSLFKDGRFLTLAVGKQLPEGIIPLLVEDRQGYLWLGVASGSAIIRFDHADFEAAAMANARMPYSLYDETDGMNGQLLRVNNPSGVLAADGHLWVLSGDGVVVVDPSMLPNSHLVSRPILERVVVDGRHVTATTDTSFPAGTSTVEVHFTSVSLSAASKLRFRYALDQVDRTWVDAGRERRVTYTNLGPGQYQFRVQAMSEGGVASPESIWSFVVQPAFYQTRWFHGLAVLSGFSLLWGAWRLRLRRVRHEYDLVAEERARLGRDIHDNLLQNLVTVGWDLEVLASESDTGSVAAQRAALSGLGAQVRRCIHEARRSIWELRSTSGLGGRDLATAIGEFTDTISVGSSVRISASVVGSRRSCSPFTEEQLLLIAMEAIRNAARHADADHIDVTLSYDDGTTVLTIQDDGKGFVYGQTKGEWHWGLKLMEERATRIHGQLMITSAPGSGTVVRVAVPL